jgi:SAM-dependent methyltransferase
MSTVDTLRIIKHGSASSPRIIDHFHASSKLYRMWSEEGHLHFGYWRWPIAPWDRRSMLDEMVHQVVQSLMPRKGDRYADLGCGYGAAARLVARSYDVHVDAFSIVPEQVKEGRERAVQLGCNDLVSMHLRDMRNTQLPNACMQGAYALESWCYGKDETKADAIQEAARILEPGASLAVVDGFVVRPADGIRASLLRMVEHGWALECFPRIKPFLAALERNGFHRIEVKDLSGRVALSALHGPPLMLWTLIRQIGRHQRLTMLERSHLRSCMLGILMGTQRDLFRYLMITAIKR